MELTAEVEIAAPTSVRTGFGAARPGTDADSVAEVITPNRLLAI